MTKIALPLFMIEWRLAAMIFRPNPLSLLLVRDASGGPWHFPDGRIIHGETVSCAITFNFYHDFGVDPEKIYDRAAVLIQIIREVEDKHVNVLHFKVSLPNDAKLLPRPGIEYAWLHWDLCISPAFLKLTSPSTAEIFRLMSW